MGCEAGQMRDRSICPIHSPVRQALNQGWYKWDNENLHCFLVRCYSNGGGALFCTTSLVFLLSFFFLKKTSVTLSHLLLFPVRVANHCDRSSVTDLVHICHTKTERRLFPLPKRKNVEQHHQRASAFVRSLALA